MFIAKRVPTRLIGAATIGVMIAGSSVAAQAATRHKPIIRIVKLTYQGGCGLALGVADATPDPCVNGASYNLALKKGEKYISIKVADDVAPAVPGVLWLGTGLNAPNTQFCTTLKNFLATGTQPQLDLFDGADSGCPGSALTGTVTVTFSSVPVK